MPLAKIGFWAIAIIEHYLLQTVPVVSAVMGSVAGLPAVQACLCHFNLMVKDTSQVFVAGPPVVQAAHGVEITKEELGDASIQLRSGTINKRNPVGGASPASHSTRSQRSQ